MIYGLMFILVVSTIFLLYKVFFRVSYQGNAVKHFLFVSGGILTTIICNIFRNYAMSYLLGFMCSILLVLFTFKTSISEKTAYFLFSIFFISIIESTFEIVFYDSFVYREVLFTCILLGLMSIMLLGFSLVGPMEKSDFTIVKPLRTPIILFMMVLSFLLSLFSFIVKTFDLDKYEKAARILIFFSGLIIIFLILFIISRQNKVIKINENLHQEKTIYMLKENQVILKGQKAEQTNRYRHEMTNHLIALNYYLNKNMHDQAKLYLAEISEQLKNITEY